MKTIQNLLFFLFILITLNACSSKTTGEKKTINTIEDVSNEVGENHLNVPFTHAFVELEPGYSISKVTTQIIKNDNITGINIFEFQGKNFFFETKDFSKKYFEKKGISTHEYLQFKLNGNPAILMLLTSPDKITKSYQIFTGDSTYTLMMVGYSRVNDTTSIQEIKKMMLTLVYDKTMTLDYKELAPFTFNEDETRYKLTQATSGFYTFSIDGKTAKEKPSSFMELMIMPSNNQSPPIFVENMALKYQMDQEFQMTMLEALTYRVYQHECHHRVYDVKHKNERFQLFIFAMFNEDIVLTIVGRANSYAHEDIREMKKFVKELSFK